MVTTFQTRPYSWSNSWKTQSAFSISVDWIVLTIEEASPMTISSLASDISQWITKSGNGLPTSKLSLLWSPAFQSLVKDHFDNHFIQSLRLLIWATTLLNFTTSQPQQSAYIKAEISLKRLVNLINKF
jgi:hypothetical protein